MKFKAYTGITWSILELTGLIEDEDSRVYFEKVKKHLGLHPFHLTNLSAALNEILSSNLNSYDSDLKGFLLAYKNPKLLTPLGEIFYDTCFIHVDIEADFYIFRPVVGCTLKGIVNKKGLDHIGILVHKAFNVSISKPDNEEDWPGENIEIGQEVRFEITLLDFTSKLPFIRGVLKPDEYLRGCKLMEKASKNRKQSCNNLETGIENSVKKNSVEGDKHEKRHTFFATDSENNSDEDVARVKHEHVQRKKSRKKHVEEEEGTDEIKEDRKVKKRKESKHKLVKEERAHDRCTNNDSVNGDLEGNKELGPVDSKSKARKKSKGESSQSSVDDNTDVKLEKHSSKKSLKKLSSLEFQEAIGKIKLEHRTESSDAEQNIIESKANVKKLSLKRKLLDDSEASSVEINTPKCKKESDSPRKQSSKRTKASLAQSGEIPFSIKSEQLSNIYSDVEEVPKKKHRKHKQCLKVEILDDEEDGNIGEISTQKRSKKSNTLDAEFANVKIKKEKVTSGSENTQDEDHAGTSNVPGGTELNTNTYNSSNGIEGDENHASKKKRKKHWRKSLMDVNEIKVEPVFEDVVVKIEKPDHVYDNTAEGIHPDGDIPAVNSLKKEHQTKVQDSIDNDQVDIKTRVKRSKKKGVDTGSHSGKVKKEIAMTDASDVDASDVSLKTSRKSKKHGNNASPHKQSSKSRKLEEDIESEFDFRNVQIKTERFPDS